MEGQIELADYLESLEKQGFSILDYIGIGRENAKTRQQLCICAGVQDRAVRELIHQARRETAIFNMQDGKGYFIPDMGRHEEQMLLARYVQQEESRMKSVGWSLKGARKMLTESGIDWRDYGKSKQG